MPDNPRQLVRHGGDGLGRSEASFPAAETFAQIVLAAPETLGGQPEGHGGPALHVAGFDGNDFAAGNAVVGTESQPGGETFGGGKPRDEIRPQFGEEHQGGVDLEAGHLREIDATEAVEFGAGIEMRFVALGFLVLQPGGGKRLLV